MQRPEPPALVEELRDVIPDMVRIRSGRIPGTEVLDIGSSDGFLAAGLAERSSGWTVHAALAPEDAPENVHAVDVEPHRLPFEDDQLAAIVGAYVLEPMDAFGPDLLNEASRVLVPEGRFTIVFRTPGPRASDVARTIPANAIEIAGRNGFDSATETTERHLHDGSELRLLRAVAPS